MFYSEIHRFIVTESTVGGRCPCLALCRTSLRSSAFNLFASFISISCSSFLRALLLGGTVERSSGTLTPLETVALYQTCSRNPAFFMKWEFLYRRETKVCAIISSIRSVHTLNVTTHHRCSSSPLLFIMPPPTPAI